MILPVIGWISTALYLGNHACLAVKPGYRLRLYYLLNLAAASGVAVSSAALGSWQAVVVNVFWAFLSVAGLSRSRILERARPSATVILSPVAAIGITGLAYATVNFGAGMSLLGWAATGLFCGAYLLLTARVLPRSRFLLCNALAAYGLTPILYLDANWPVLVLEIAWGTISICGWVAASRGVRGAAEDSPEPQ